MKTYFALILSSAAAMGFAIGDEPALLPGNTAPKVDVSVWVKGSAPKAPGLRVVEFWATWCAPCKTSIPHLTELAHTYKGKIDFYGISVFERVPNIPAAVNKFVAEMGDKMDYNVGIDTTGKFMAMNWMEAAQQHGIPTAFIIDANDKVLWVGHPLGLDFPLKHALAGTLDWKKEREQAIKNAASFRKSNEGRREAKLAVDLYESGHVAEAEKEFDRIAAGNENDRQLIQAQRMRLYIAHKDPKRDALISKLIVGGSGDQSLLAQVGYTQFTAIKGDLELAKTVAILLAAKGTDTIALYYAALTLAKLDMHKQAAETAEKSLVACAGDKRMSKNAKFKETVTTLRDEELGKAKTVKKH